MPPGYLVSWRETEDYIRESAKRQGVDPDIAVEVARAEGSTNGNRR